MASTSDRTLIHEGWALHHQAARTATSSGIKKWTRYWIALHDNILSFYTSNKKTSDAMVGTLTLGPNTELSNVPSEFQQVGFGFQLTTSTGHGAIRTNILMMERQNDRDLWKAFIGGLSHGVIPTDVQLLPGQINAVCDVIRNLNLHVANPGRRGSAVKTWHPSAARSSGQRPMTSYADTTGRSNSRATSDDVRDRGSTAAGDSRRMSLPTSGQLQRTEQRTNVHRFYNNQQLNFNPPTWFVECAREKAEAILSLSRQYGNVLLRPCSSEPNTKYALSYRSETEGGSQVNHYAVIGDSSGFIIDVLDKHHTMPCLSDVMQYFITKCGPSVRPLTNSVLSSPTDQSSHSSTMNRLHATQRSDEYDVVMTSQGSRSSDGARQPVYLTYSGAKTTGPGTNNKQSMATEPIYSFYPNYDSGTTPVSPSRTGYSSTAPPSPQSPSAVLVPPPPPAAPDLPAHPPPPPPPLPPLLLPTVPSITSSPVKLKETRSGDSKEPSIKSPQDRRASVSVCENSLQQNLQTELQSKVSKYWKGTYTPSSALKLNN